MAVKRKSTRDVAEPQKAAREVIKTLGGIKPAIKLDETELQVFKGHLETRPIELWSPSDNRALCQLAKISGQLERLQDILDEEGFFETDSRGRTVMHPAVAVQTKLIQAYNTLASQLRLGVSLSLLNPNEGNNQSKEERRKNATQRQVNELSDSSDGLIPGYEDFEDEDEDDDEA
jgi:hypothetical protein